VTAVGRRAAEPPAEYRSQPGFDADKLRQVVLDMDRLEEEGKAAFAGADSVFCCLGTTRGVSATAGTAVTGRFRAVFWVPPPCSGHPPPCAGSTTPASLLQVAGSADAFRKVDLDYVAASARAASAGGVPHFSLVTAQGARAGVWASDLKPFHGLLYMKVKGQVGAH
jgi:oxidoreductase